MWYGQAPVPEKVQETQIAFNKLFSLPSIIQNLHFV